VGIVICTREIGRYMEGKCDGGNGGRKGGIRVSGRIFDMFKERIWGGRREVGESGRTEKARARRKDDEEIHTRGSGYEGRPLVEEFKRRMNGGIWRKLMEAENLPASIEQWYRRATALDRNWRESRREEERLRKKKVGGGKQEQRQSLP